MSVADPIPAGSARPGETTSGAAVSGTTSAVDRGVTRRAVSLLVVLVLAKGLALAGRDLSLTAWAPVAWFWQDVLVVLIFAAVDTLVRRAWVGMTMYVAIAVYVAANVPLVRAVSSALTWPMLRATSGTLSDSIACYLTTANVVMMIAVLVVAAAVPRLVSRVSFRTAIGLGVLSLPVICLGPTATARTETRGLHRNFLLTLVTTAFPRVETHDESTRKSQDWRRSPFSVNSNSGERNAEPASLLDLQGAGRGKNVVLIVLESAGAQYLKPYGASEDPMPFLTELAGRSILFENAYAVYPESIKGLLAVLSSVTPAIDTEAEQYESIGRLSLAVTLNRAGYRTGLFHSGRFAYLGMQSVIRNRGFDVLEDAGHISGEHQSSFGVDEPSTVERMLSWIDGAADDEPFFLTYLPIAGHHPYDSPEAGPFPEADDIGRYRNALHYADSAVRQFVHGLESRGLDQDTLLVIIGDHAQAFGQHDGNYGHTFFLYEENIRVPLLIALPESTTGERVQRVASSLDIAPTILDLLGQPLPVEFEGQSLLQSAQQMALFFTDYSQALLGLRDRQWKFLYEVESGRASLFDLTTDPGESRDLSTQHPGRVEGYQSRLMQWSAATRARVLRSAAD